MYAADYVDGLHKENAKLLKLYELAKEENRQLRLINRQLKGEPVTDLIVDVETIYQGRDLFNHDKHN